jgi:hypothetical protein
MRFEGSVVVGNETRPCRFEIGSPRSSDSAPYECRVVVDQPMRDSTTIFGEDEKNAYECALLFVRQLLRGGQLLDVAGAPVDWPIGAPPLDE